MGGTAPPYREINFFAPNGAKIVAFGPQITIFWRNLFFAELGGTAPLNGKSFCQKYFSRIGGYPPPLTERIHSVIFCRFPNLPTKSEESYFWNHVFIENQPNIFFEFWQDEKPNRIWIINFAVLGSFLDARALPPSHDLGQSI